MNKLLALAAIAFVPLLAHAKDLETTHLFGFTLGSDVNDVGEREAESDATGRFGKAGGSFSAVSQETGIKFIPFRDFSIEPVVGVAYHDVSGVPGLDDRRQLAFDNIALEMRYRLLNREHAPFGLTIGLDPHWSRVDDISAAPVDHYGAQLWLIVDKELVENRIFAAFNLIYAPQAARSRVTGVWEHQSGFGISGAITTQILPGILIGAEARYLRSYDGLGLDSLMGGALFMGPTFYARFSDRFWMGAAWNIQVAGSTGNGPGALDLTNFERHQVKLRFGYNF